MDTSDRPNTEAVLDDTSPDIQYEGNWTFIEGDPLDSNVFAQYINGPTYNRSLHAARSSGASMSFTFNGSAVGIYASLNRTEPKAAPHYTCAIDHNGFDYEYKMGYHQINSYPLCENTDLEEGIHNVTLTVKSVQQGYPLLFDFIKFYPSHNDDGAFGNANRRYFYNESHVNLSPGWDSYQTDGYYQIADALGANVKLNFNGISASMTGLVLNNTNSSASLSYTIDNGQPIPFTMPASQNISMEGWNQVLFTTPLLPAGDHTLVVSNDNSAAAQPLTFHYFDVERPYNSSASALWLSRFAASQSSTSTAHPSGGTIAGIVVSSVLFMALLTLGLVTFWRRRAFASSGLGGGRTRKQQIAARDDPTAATPFLLSVPFSAENDYYYPYAAPPLPPKDRSLAADALALKPGQSRVAPPLPPKDRSLVGPGPSTPPRPGLKVRPSQCSSVHRHRAAMQGMFASSVDDSPLTSTEAGGSYYEPSSSVEDVGLGADVDVLMHTDSGMRGYRHGSGNGRRVIEVPPLYEE